MRYYKNVSTLNDIFNNFKPKKRKEILPTGFIVGLKNIYLSTNIGRLLVIDIKSGKTISTLKIDNDNISKLDQYIDIKNKSKKTIELIEYFEKLKNLDDLTKDKKIVDIKKRKKTYRKRKFYKKTK